MNNDAKHLILPKRGIWGGYVIEKIGGHRGYFWIGQQGAYLMAITNAEAKRVLKFLKANLK